MPRTVPVLLMLALTVAGCQKYVPANLPLQLGDSTVADTAAYRDQLGRELGGPEAEGPEYRFTMNDGNQFFMKSPRIAKDSVVGFYRPTTGSRYARAAVPLYDIRIVEQQQVDWLATISLLTVPITLAVLLTY